MPNGPRLIVDGACYHIMARGNNKQKIFNRSRDFYRYMAMLMKYKKKYGLKLYGYCLMPNHVHMIGQIYGKNSLYKFMHGLNRAYTGYFNTVYQRVGHLWQGRFKSKVVVRDKYLIDCINYIELNPVRAEMVDSPHKYIWSSYRERNMIGSSFGILDNLNL